MRRMCELFEISRAGLYYKPVGESEYDIMLMNLIDEQYTKMPFYGSRKIQKQPL
jgi:putative transposase